MIVKQPYDQYIGKAFKYYDPNWKVDMRCIILGFDDGSFDLFQLDHPKWGVRYDFKGVEFVQTDGATRIPLTHKEKRLSISRIFTEFPEGLPR